MEKQVVLYDSLYKGKTKKDEDFYSLKFFQIVTGRWGTFKHDVSFYLTPEQYAEADAFVNANGCVIGDALEIGLKMSKDLTRAPKFCKILRVVEKSPLIKYAVSDDEPEVEENEDIPANEFVPVVPNKSKK